MLRIIFNHERCQELYRELGLKKPVEIRVYNRTLKLNGVHSVMGQRLSEGSWTPDIHQVIVEAGMHENLSGLELKKQLVMTFVHEVRHCHQYEYWTSVQWAKEIGLSYTARPSERDAEGWAKEHWREWQDVLSVSRIATNRRFGKLSAAAERSKR